MQSDFKYEKVELMQKHQHIRNIQAGAEVRSVPVRRVDNEILVLLVIILLVLISSSTGMP